MDNILKGLILLLMCGVFGDEVKSVNEGDSVTLPTDITEIKKTEKILWRFEEAGSTNLLVQMHGNKILYKDPIDERFKDRLLISNTQSGDLTIKNMRIKHAGVYEAEIQAGSGTSHKRFNVTVNESSRVIDPSEVKSVSVTEGDSVTLQTDVQTQRGDLILWGFGPDGDLIAKVDMEDNKMPYIGNGRFKDRLKLDAQTGNLTITNTKTEDSGFYKLKISSNSRETKFQTFSVSVKEVESVSVMKGETVTLKMNADTQPDDVIQLKFKNTSIAEVDRRNHPIRDYVLDERFIGRLHVDMTGYVIIKELKTEDSGLYDVSITNSKHIIQKRFNLTVTGLSATDIVLICSFLVGFIALVIAVLKIRHFCRKRKQKTRDQNHEDCLNFKDPFGMSNSGDNKVDDSNYEGITKAYDNHYSSLDDVNPIKLQQNIPKVGATNREGDNKVDDSNYERITEADDNQHSTCNP